MKVYLASRYSRFKEMQSVRSDLELLGHQVTSRWINGDHQISDKDLNQEQRNAEKIRFAREDFEDLIDADILLTFTEEPRSTNSRGGRHVEFGIAIGLEKDCYVVGPRENVFHCLECVQWFPNYDAFIGQPNPFVWSEE